MAGGEPHATEAWPRRNAEQSSSRSPGSSGQTGRRANAKRRRTECARRFWRTRCGSSAASGPRRRTATAMSVQARCVRLRGHNGNGSRQAGPSKNPEEAFRLTLGAQTLANALQRFSRQGTRRPAKNHPSAAERLVRTRLSLKTGWKSTSPMSLIQKNHKNYRAARPRPPRRRRRGKRARKPSTICNGPASSGVRPTPRGEARMAGRAGFPDLPRGKPRSTKATQGPWNALTPRAATREGHRWTA